MTLIRIKDSNEMTHLINLESVTISMRDVQNKYRVVAVLQHGLEIILYNDSSQVKAEELIDRIFKVQFDNKVMLAQRDGLIDFESNDFT